jgi:Raf kinase inhibitor-like YbhB/YbcL family protein
MITSRRIVLAALLAAAVVIADAGCSASNKLAMNSDLTGGLYAISVSSPAFQNNGPIPERYTEDGMNLSPPLKWSKGPNLVKEWVVIVEDADARGDKGRPLVHWAIYRIPANVTELPEGASRNTTFTQGKNYQGESAYAGPQPPPGKLHHYYFEVFALDTEQDWPAGADRDTIRSMFKGHVLSKGMLIGTYQAEK